MKLGSVMDPSWSFRTSDIVRVSQDMNIPGHEENYESTVNNDRILRIIKNLFPES